MTHPDQGPYAGHDPCAHESMGLPVRDASVYSARRDRHGRRYRGPLAWPRTPSMLTRSRAFDEAVLRSVERLERRWGESVEHIEIGVEEVPPSDPSSWEDAVPLGRAFPAEGRHRPRMVIYRLPIQTRSRDSIERDALVEHVVATQLAALLGRDLDEDDL